MTSNESSSLHLNKVKVGVPYVLLVLVVCGRSCFHLLRTQSYTKIPAKREAPSPCQSLAPPLEIWLAIFFPKGNWM